MSQRHFAMSVIAACAGAAVLGSGVPARLLAQTAADRPSIVVLATGGTIAGAAATNVQAGYTSGQVGVEQLIAAVPEAQKIARLRGEQVANIGSQDMNDEVWFKLAKRVNELAAQPDVDGIVITHGTDTIEETGYFLNLVVKTRKPVVLTAAMRPSTALSADGPLNFFNAVAVAADKDAAGRGVLVVVNDWVHGASSLGRLYTARGTPGGDAARCRGPDHRDGCPDADAPVTPSPGRSARIAGWPSRRPPPWWRKRRIRPCRRFQRSSRRPRPQLQPRLRWRKPHRRRSLLRQRQPPNRLRLPQRKRLRPSWRLWHRALSRRPTSRRSTICFRPLPSCRIWRRR